MQKIFPGTPKANNIGGNIIRTLYARSSEETDEFIFVLIMLFLPMKVASTYRCANRTFAVSTSTPCEFTGDMIKRCSINVNQNRVFETDDGSVLLAFVPQRVNSDNILISSCLNLDPTMM